MKPMPFSGLKPRYAACLFALALACGGASDDPIALCPTSSLLDATEVAVDRLEHEVELDCSAPDAIAVARRETGECIADPDAICISSATRGGQRSPPLADLVEIALREAGFGG